MVFDGVVSAALEKFGNFSPAVAQESVGKEEHPLFVFTPVLFFYVWVEMVVPTFPALFADPA